MSVSKRRLSSGSGLLSLCADDDSDDDDLSVTLQEKSIYTFPKKANSRRRSSFGGANSSKSPINAVEQARIAEMYKTVIQMSSENVRTSFVVTTSFTSYARCLLSVFHRNSTKRTRGTTILSIIWAT
jgi:hypothetical protein